MQRYNSLTHQKEELKIPYIAEDWRILFKPEKQGNYVNDHTLVMGSDGKWHLYGITSFGGGAYCERYFVHGVGDTLFAPLKEFGRTIDRGTPAWAPCVIRRDENYYMFYGPSPTSLAVSFDMYEWYGHTVTLNNEPVMAAHRDHFVLEVAPNEYLMYVTGVHNKKGAISLFSSQDLLTWDFEGFALTSGDDAPLTPGWGAMESPFVLKKDGMYYLFVTYTNSTSATYNDTMVFCSADPKNFGIYNGEKGGTKPITWLCAHAPEIVEIDGETYITTCGWNGRTPINPGCVSIAKLNWKDE